MKPRSRFPALAAGAAGALFALLPAALGAQAGADFLFRRPVVSLTFSGGWAQPRAGSELFDFTRSQLTLDRSDFGAPALQGELAVRAGDRVDVVAGGGWSGTEVRSEFRDWIGTDGLPIEQTTRFSRAPFWVGAKAYLSDRGRSLGRYAWVPARWAPYLGAGAGGVWYRFEQFGEFVDYETLDIFRDRFGSEGWAPSLHARAGLDLTLLPRLVLTGEGRYTWAKAELGRDFVDFDDIDLSGLQATVGLSLRF